MKLTDIYVYQDRSEATGELIYKISDPSKGLRLKITTVSTGKRFGHYIIDRIVYYALGFALGYILGMLIPEVLFGNNEVLLNVFLTWGIVVMYYFVSELLLQTSPGKMVTGCVVIDEYGEKPTAGQLLGRSFARIIPFEPFSCLSNPSRGWHDTLSNTYVVEKKDLEWMLRLRDEYQSEGAAAYNSLISEEN